MPDNEKWDEKRAILAPLAAEVKRHLAALESLVKELENKGCTVRYFFNNEELKHKHGMLFDFEIRMSIETEL
jgi:hypothetical protein